MKAIKSRLIPVLLLLTLSLGFKLSSKQYSGNLTSPLNIYLSDTLLFVSDSVHGINVYSVKNPSAPVFKLNIPIKGNTGLAVKDSFVFANAYSSLLVLKIFNDSLYKVVKFIRNDFNYYYGAIPDYEGTDNSGLNCGCYGPKETGVATAGVAYDTYRGGGSYATFAVIDSFLYYLDRYNGLVTLDISNPVEPVELSRNYMSWIETIFPTRDYLFIGGATGMYIMNRKDPGSPQQIGMVSHFKSCDPVVVQDTLAYVTLRGGNRCGEPHDALLVLSIKNPAMPWQIEELNPVTPYGLTIRDSLLYVSNGYNGYTLYNTIRPDSLKQVKVWTDAATKDFIWAGNLMFVMGFSNIRILDMSAPQSPSLISTIE